MKLDEVLQSSSYGAPVMEPRERRFTADDGDSGSEYFARLVCRPGGNVKALTRMDVCLPSAPGNEKDLPESSPQGPTVGGIQTSSGSDNPRSNSLREGRSGRLHLERRNSVEESTKPMSTFSC